ncbi:MULTISPECIES: hypothetical protein [Pseudomonas]|uniref:Uncharacterized protein n=1 Tax=Pseudomonas fluorescens TaxID=294 RepID=A0A7Z3GYZ2_PSEFL|nr:MULTISPECIES: hypothetical protein [Pseudomonas]QJP93884.1 hypothetical protein C6Y56_04510 [Pseudomonas fluorescens]
MTTQKIYNFEPQPDFDDGDVTIKWRGVTLTSTIVFFTSGLITASYLKPVSTSKSKGGTQHDTFVVSLLEGPYHNFQQSYERGVTEHHFQWALNYDSVMHYPDTGTVTGKFTTGYAGIEATIHMIFADRSVAEITFKARKRT